MKVEIGKICNRMCGFCEYDHNCRMIVEVEDGTERPRPEIVYIDIMENGRIIGKIKTYEYKNPILRSK